VQDPKYTGAADECFLSESLFFTLESHHGVRILLKIKFEETHQLTVMALAKLRASRSNKLKKDGEVSNTLMHHIEDIVNRPPKTPTMKPIVSRNIKKCKEWMLDSKLKHVDQLLEMNIK